MKFKLRKGAGLAAGFNETLDLNAVWIVNAALIRKLDGTTRPYTNEQDADKSDPNLDSQPVLG